MAGSSDACPASLYDGKIAVRREGAVRLVSGALYFEDDDGLQEPIDPSDLRHVDQTAAGAVYALKGVEGWRLSLKADPPPEIGALLPAHDRYGSFIDRIGLVRASIAFILIGAVLIATILAMPRWLAPLVPMSVERKIGAAMAGGFGAPACTGSKGEAALASLVAELDAKPAEIDVHVADISMTNAVALPGGKVIIFRGLIDDAESPDEVAGVLAHEIGHVRERHVMQALLRQFGLTILLGGGDSQVGSTMGGLLSLSYSRGAEREADRWSMARLKEARISPAATADFFDRLARERGEGSNPALVGYLSSHPHSAERSEAFKASERDSIDYRPALTEAQWSALQAICGEPEEDGSDER